MDKPNFKPILFSTPMVQAILRGEKTQTRRICKHQFWQHSELVDVNTNKITQKVDRNVSCPFGEIGTVLWVRETFINGHEMDEHGGFKLESGLPIPKIWYRADNDLQVWLDGYSDFGTENIPWKPSIHMPREACRLFLRITDISVERLNDISEEDAIAEGIEKVADYGTSGYMHYGFPDSAFSDIDAVYSFETLWESINGKGSWEANPWCWKISFVKIDKPENW